MARPQRPAPRELKVMNTKRVTPNMHRVTLGGKGLVGFQKGSEGGYIKLRLSGPDNGKLVVRTYTIRSESETGLDVDFALHGSDDDCGPATSWAINARIGDAILLGGPGAAKPLPEGLGPFLLVGDMTALPAISVNLEALPDDAKGNAIILVRDENDKQDLDAPAGVKIRWIVEPNLGADPSLLADAVRELADVDEMVYAWVACEFEAMKLLRQFFRTEKKFGKDRLYISSYWKRGLVEDDHKQVKRVDAEMVS